MQFAAARNMGLGKNKKKDTTAHVDEVQLDFSGKRKMPKFTFEDTHIPREYSYKPLVLRGIPYFFWFLGFLFLLFGVLLTYNVLSPMEGKIFNGFYGDVVWEYIVLAFIYIFGVSFFITAKYETITLDKLNNSLTISKLKLLQCKSKKLELKLNSINAVFGTRLIAQGNNKATCLYKVGIRFNDNETVYCFKTLFKPSIIWNVIKLRSYVYGERYTYGTIEKEMESNVYYNRII